MTSFPSTGMSSVTYYTIVVDVLYYTGTYVPDPTDTYGYNSDKIGISWVSFDSTSGSSDSATPRIFVGVANAGSDNIFVSNDSGSTCKCTKRDFFYCLRIATSQGVPSLAKITPSFPIKELFRQVKGFYMSHTLTVLDPMTELLVGYHEKHAKHMADLSLHLTGAVRKYNITSGAWTDITPVSGSDLYFGFGGLTVDIQKPGTVMVAALNSWWPEGQIFRSTDSGTTWSPLWAWNGYPNINKYYTYDDSLAPWLGPNYVVTTLGTLQVGWMMEALAIDPFDSNHWLYGTGATIFGGHDLLKWDTTHNVTIKSLADGVEETAIQSLLSPPTGPNLLSAMYDLEGRFSIFVYGITLTLHFVYRLCSYQFDYTSICSVHQPSLDWKS